MTSTWPWNATCAVRRRQQGIVVCTEAAWLRSLLRHCALSDRKDPMPVLYEVVMTPSPEGLVQKLLALPVFRSEWVLWLLLACRCSRWRSWWNAWIFYRRHKVAFESLREEFSKCLDKGDFEAAAKLLAKTDKPGKPTWCWPACAATPRARNPSRIS